MSFNLLNFGNFKSAFLTNKQCVLERHFENETVWVAINAEENPFTINFQTDCKKMVDMETNDVIEFNGAIEMAPYSAKFFRNY